MKLTEVMNRNDRGQGPALCEHWRMWFEFWIPYFWLNSFIQKGSYLM